MATNLPVVPFDYDSVRADIVDRFSLKGYDANFAGSNAAIISDVIAYVVGMLNVNTSANIGEMLLAKSTQKKNILYLAREQGYEAQNKVSYQYRLTFIAKKDITLPDTDTTLRIYELPKYFSTTNGGKNYYYFGVTITKQLSNATITDMNDTSKYFTVAMKEGTLYLSRDYPATLQINTPTTLDVGGNIIANNKIDIPYINVEDDGLELTLNYVDANGIEHINEPWYKSSQFLTDKDTNLEKKFVRLDNIETSTPQIYFNIAGVGNELRLNTQIYVNVLISSGSAGAATSNWAIVDTNISNNFVMYTGTDVNLSELLLVTGANEEDPDQVKINAPLFHNSANRAVTKYDYISICNRFANVEYTQCWGGDEETPMNLGNIYLSMIPSYRSTTFSNDVLNYNYNLIDKDITTKLFMRSNELNSTSYDQNNSLINPGVFDTLSQYKIMTMQLHNISPFYIDFDYEITVVKYSLNNTKQATQQDIFNIINNFFTTNIMDFEQQYFHSNLIKRMDKEMDDLSGIECNLYPKISIYGRSLEGSLWTNYNLYEYFTSQRTEMGITFLLAFPFESVYDTNGDIIPSILPDINTTNFITTGDTLVVDWTSLVMVSGATVARDAEYYYYNIKYNNVVCGRYYVENSIKKSIKINFYVNEDGSTPTDARFIVTPLTNLMFSQVRRLTLKYKTNNFKLYRHMYPRLTSVKYL
jgi:hypothetical protein